MTTRPTQSEGFCERAERKAARVISHLLHQPQRAKGGENRKTFRAFVAAETGQSVPEYALLFSLVTAALIGACTALGISVENAFATVKNLLP